MADETYKPCTRLTWGTSEYAEKGYTILEAPDIAKGSRWN